MNKAELLTKIRFELSKTKINADVNYIKAQNNAFYTNNTTETIKISELPSNSGVEPADLLVFVDNNAQTTNKITFSDFISNIKIDGGDIDEQ